MRKTLVLGCTDSVATLLAGPQPASAGLERAAAMCEGEVATIVGHPGQGILTGTEGPDVIVTNGAGQVLGLGGNDLICVTGKSEVVFAGDGDDTVDAHTHTGFASVQLGAGSDQFLGGPGFDRVEGGTFDTFADRTDAEPDVIDVGDGGARVASGDGGLNRDDGRNGDQVTFGRSGKKGNGLEYYGYEFGEGLVDFGPEAGQLTLLGGVSQKTQHVLIDNRSQVIRVGDQVILHWTGSVDTFNAPLPRGGGYTFRGGPMDETLLFAFDQPEVTQVRMGGGDDLLSYQGCTSLASGSKLAGGSGRDKFVAYVDGNCSSTILDLAKESITQQATSGTFAAAVVGFEDAKVSGPIVRLRGDDADNTLIAVDCDLKIQGRGGDDTLVTRRNSSSFCTGSPVARGGPGDDTLVGSLFDDTLVGGAGRDNADGKLGHDACRAEVTRNCE